jgi:predicted ATPase
VKVRREGRREKWTEAMAMAEPTFGVLLKRHRLAARLSQEDLAELARLSTRGISDLERGVRRTPRRATVTLLASALSLGPADLGRFEAAGTGSAASLNLSALRPHNLPAPPTTLIGRSGELGDALAKLARKEVRLLTLTGAGGVGKTRLAHAVGLALLHRYGERVWQVELAPLRDTGLVAGAISEVLGLEETSDSPLVERLVKHLCGRPILLLLHNFEHLPAAAALVARLLASCPKLRVLVTSRAPLHLQDEHELPVLPLAVPDPKHLPTLPELARNPSVELFVRRAQAVRPDFTLDPANAETVAAICRRLDGLPLALELAAARMKILTAQALLLLLGQRLPLLTGGPQDVPERQRTLRNTLAWSYDLLSGREQSLFRRLSVFTSGCTMATVKSVCRAGDDTGGPMLDWVTALLDQNLLLQLAPDGQDGEEESRFGMLETTREYGLECLAAVGELGRSREREATDFPTLETRAGRVVTGPNRHAEPATLDIDHDSPPAALEFGHGKQREDDVELRMAAEL